MKKIQNYFMLVFILLANFKSFSQSDKPKLKTSGKTIENFIPSGWKKIYQASGDLNKDLLVDEALIIENTNPENFIKNDGMGGDTLNLNTRMLLVLLKEKNNTFKLVAKNSKFIPTQNDSISPCLSDPLSETKGIEIKKGVLIVGYQYFMSCGSWSVSNVYYTFRFQNQKFELIGFDSSDFHRASGEESTMSINFSTKKTITTTGGNMFEEKENSPKKKWKNLKFDKLLNLEEMDSESLSKMHSFN